MKVEDFFFALVTEVLPLTMFMVFGGSICRCCHAWQSLGVRQQAREMGGAFAKSSGAEISTYKMGGDAPNYID